MTVKEFNNMKGYYDGTFVADGETLNNYLVRDSWDHQICGTMKIWWTNHVEEDPDYTVKDFLEEVEASLEYDMNRETELVEVIQ